MSVELHCVQDRNKVRVRIASYIDQDGKRYNDVYNNDWNCRFSRSLRMVGKRFLVPASNVKLLALGETYFYSVSDKNIITLQNNQKTEAEILAETVVYETSADCVVCMDQKSEIIFSPCGHLCSCASCGKQLSKCCICRTEIKHQIAK